MAEQRVVSAATAVDAIIQVRGLRRSFKMGDSAVRVLDGAELDVLPGEFVAIEGRSGSGKSTLLHLMGALDSPNAGSILYAGRDLARLSSNARAALRNKDFGFVFQFYHLLPELNVLENTLISAMVEHSFFAWLGRRGGLKTRAVEVLDSLGLGHRMRHRPSQLSGGERQRVAIARALMNKPRVLFADEPTGNLDYETGRQIMAVLEGLHKTGQTIVMVTHDRTLAREADRIVVLERGKVLPQQPGDVQVQGVTGPA